jgi:hypothetical protein
MANFNLRRLMKILRSNNKLKKIEEKRTKKKRKEHKIWMDLKTTSNQEKLCKWQSMINLYQVLLVISG